MVLLDTAVLSELRRKERDPGVVEWIGARRTADLFLSAVTIGEIERGIARQQPRNPDFASALARWLDTILSLYAPRILGIDIATARRWGRLSAQAGHDGSDLLIAATAQENGLTVVTRNTRHFEPTGVPVLDPFRGSQGELR
jgi:predicted nucleic acid-binding protein